MRFRLAGANGKRIGFDVVRQQILGTLSLEGFQVLAGGFPTPSKKGNGRICGTLMRAEAYLMQELWPDSRRWDYAEDLGRTASSFP